MTNRWENNGNSDRLFSWVPKSLRCSHEIAPWKKSYDQPRQHIKKQRHYFVFPVVIYGCENWTIKKAERRRIDAFGLWCWRILLRVPWTARRSNQSVLKEISPEYSLWRTDVEAETPILWPPGSKSWVTRKDADAGQDWRWEEKGTTEDEMVGWHHRLNGHGFGWTLGVGDGQGGLACCNAWGRKELDVTERLNWTELKFL